MKIIHITLGKANPDRMNGVNKVVHQLATTMQKQGQDVSVWGISSTNHDIIQRAYKFRIFISNPKFFHINSDLQLAINSIPKDSIVHFHGVMIPLFWSIAQQLVKNNIPYVITPHGALLRKSLNRYYWKKFLYLHIFEKRMLKNAYAIHSITIQEKKEIPFKLNSIIIPNGTPQITIDTKTQNEQIIFGYIGRLDIQHKGLDLLLEGFNTFYQQTKQGYLYLAGDGIHKKWIKSYIQQHNLSDRVILTGEIHGISKKQLLSKIDVFVHPSRWDVLPTTILEAAVYTKPIIASGETGLKENIEKCQSGIIIKSLSSIEMAASLHQAYRMTNTDLKKMGSNARKMVQQDYNWSNIANAMYTKLYGQSV